MAIAGRKEWHVHGGGRAFSMMKLEKRAYLYPADVLAAIGPIDPSSEYSAAMLAAVASIMAAYLGPLLLKQKHLNTGRR